MSKPLQVILADEEMREIMGRYDIRDIFSFDAGFDRYPGIRRL